MVTSDDRNNQESAPLLAASTLVSSTNPAAAPAASGYVSDGRSVASDDVRSNRFRLLSPDFSHDCNHCLEYLVSPDDDTDDLEQCARCGARCDPPAPPGATAREARAILSAALPLTTTFFLEYALLVSSLFIIGHFGSADHLASASLAAMTYNITGLAVIEGMATSLDTFCAQAYGARRYAKVGLYFWRCTLMIAVAVVPITVLWWTAASWLAVLVPQPALLQDVQLFLRVASAGLPGLVLFETGKRYVQAQGCYEAGTWVLALAVPVNVGLCVALVRQIGFIGAPLALAATHWALAVLLGAYCIYWEPRTLQCSYPVWASRRHLKRALTHWGGMWSLAFPGLVMIESEYLSFEVLTLMSTRFGVEAIAAQSVVANAGSLIYQVPFAMGCVVSTRVGGRVGRGELAGARRTVRAGYWVAAVVGTVNCVLLVVGRGAVARLFTQDAGVIALAERLVPILAVNQVADAVATFGAAVLRGQGRQRVGGALNVVAYYAVGLPVSGWLAFGPLQMGLAGLWVGCGAGIVVLAVAASVWVRKSDWREIRRAFLARESMEGEDLLTPSESEVSIASQGW